MYFKILFLVSFYRLNTLNLRKFSLWLVHYEIENDVQMTFDDSYIFIVNQIDVFKVVLCYILLIETSFPWEVLFWDVNIESQKICTIDLWLVIYSWMDLIDNFLNSSVLFLVIEQFLLKKFFSMTCTLREKKGCTIDLRLLIYSLCEQNSSFFEKVLCCFLLIKQLEPKIIFSITWTLGEKNDVQLNFHDSYIHIVNQIDVFKVVFC